LDILEGNGEVNGIRWRFCISHIWGIGIVCKVAIGEEVRNVLEIVGLCCASFSGHLIGPSQYTAPNLIFLSFLTITKIIARADKSALISKAVTTFQSGEFADYSEATAYYRVHFGLKVCLGPHKH
jgi:hypothetical protein